MPTLNHKNSLKALALTLTLAVSTTAGATGYQYSAETPCDLRIPPVVLNRVNVKPAYRIKGRFDSTGRLWYVDAVMWIPCATLFGGLISAWWYGWYSGGSQNADWETNHFNADDQRTRDDEFQDLQIACRQFIRKNYPSDILYDNGPNLIARNYFCSEPMINGVVNANPSSNDGNGNEYSIDVMYGEAVLEHLTMEQTVQKKCEALEGCFRASNGKDFDWINDRMKKIGCM